MSNPFPMLVYKSPGKHVGPAISVDGGEKRSTTYSSKAVKSREALTEAVRNGWSPTLEQSIGIKPKPSTKEQTPEELRRDAGDAAYAAALAEGKSEDEAVRLANEAATAAYKAALPASDEAPPSRAELEAKAKELGIEFDEKVSDAKLSARIAKTLKKPEGGG